MNNYDSQRDDLEVIAKMRKLLKKFDPRLKKGSSPKDKVQKSRRSEVFPDKVAFENQIEAFSNKILSALDELEEKMNSGTIDLTEARRTMDKIGERIFVFLDLWEQVIKQPAECREKFLKVMGRSKGRFSRNKRNSDR